MASLALVVAPTLPPARANLFVLEEGLIALIDTEPLVPPDQMEAFLELREKATGAATEKRQRVAEMIRHLESQEELASREVERLRQRKARFEAVRERLRAYVVGVIERLGPNEKGKLRVLQGATVSLSARGIAPSVEILDEKALLPSCRKVSVTMPADLWDAILDSIDFELRARILTEGGTAQFESSKTATKQLLEDTIGKDVIEAEKKAGALSIASEKVPGARLLLNRHCLVVK